MDAEIFKGLTLTIKRISQNSPDTFEGLTHKQVIVCTIAARKVVKELLISDPEKSQIQFFLTCLGLNGLTHYQRRIFAEQILKLLESIDFQESEF